MGNAKETLTVLMVFTASGKTIPPLVVFPYKRPSKAVVDSMPDAWFLGKSDSGWMRSETFYEYIDNGVNKWLTDQQTGKPVILFVDGHKSHLSLTLSELCANNGIILYALPPNTTHIMQPADVSVFKPTKDQWKIVVREWLSRPENYNTIISKSTFCPVFKMVLDKMDLTDAIKNGFKRCGLYPFDADAVDYSKCIQNMRENLAKTVPEEVSQEEARAALAAINKIENRLLSKGFDVESLVDEISAATHHQNENNEIINIDTEKSTEIECVYIIDEEGTLLKQVDSSENYNFDDTFIIPSDVNTTAMFGEQTTNEISRLLKEQSINIEQIESPSSKSSTYCSPSLLQLLEIPKPIPKKDKLSTPTSSNTCAISSPTWRKKVSDKQEAKKSKELQVQIRKEERLRKKSMKKKNEKKTEIFCDECNEILISDVEEDDDKNIGCDRCPKWFHLRCTYLKGMSYEKAADKYFVCAFCF